MHENFRSYKQGHKQTVITLAWLSRVRVCLQLKYPKGFSFVFKVNSGQCKGKFRYGTSVDNDREFRNLLKFLWGHLTFAKLPV